MTSALRATDAPYAFGSSLPPGQERENLERARLYLAAIEGNDINDSPFDYLTPDVRQTEYPNQLVPMGADRDLQAIRDAGERGRRVIKAQRYEVRTAMANGSDVALEVLWVGILAIAIGSLAAGAEMRANFGVFLTLRDGLIVHQRNYDCFQPY